MATTRSGVTDEAFNEIIFFVAAAAVAVADAAVALLTALPAVEEVAVGAVDAMVADAEDVSSAGEVTRGGVTRGLSSIRRVLFSLS